MSDPFKDGKALTSRPIENINIGECACEIKNVIKEYQKLSNQSIDEFKLKIHEAAYKKGTPEYLAMHMLMIMRERNE